MVAAASDGLRRWLGVVVLILGVLLGARPALAADTLDADTILGKKRDDAALRITGVATRITAFSQSGSGYQSKANTTTQPGSARLTVFEPQVEIRAAQGDRITHRLWVPADVVTSASANAIDRSRKPDTISSASRQNEAGTLDWTTTLRATRATDLSTRNGVHLEEEWRSWHSGFTVTHGLRDKSTVLSATALTVFDWFDHLSIDGKRRGRTTRSSNTANLGITQLLSPTTVAEASYGLTLQTGELGNTWNTVPLANGGVGAEHFPESRLRHALVGRVVQALPWNGVAKAYYRFYADTWSLSAHTVEAQLLQRVSPHFFVGVGYRHHLQTGTRFSYQIAPATAVLRTADSDLERLAARSVSARASFDIPLQQPGPKSLHLDFAVERYWRDNDLQMNVFTCSTGFSY